MRLKAGQVKKPIALAVGLGTISGLLDSREGTSLITGVTGARVGLIMTLSLVLGNLLFPALMSLLTARRSFLWGFVPAAIGGILSLVIDAVMPSTQFHVPLGMRMYFFLTGLPAMALIVVVGVLSSSGPVSLIRYIIQRQRKVIPETYEGEAIRSKEGSWPPPPTVK
jgi:hypothetical protein